MAEQQPINPPQWLMDAWQARIESMGSNIPGILLEVAQWGAREAPAHRSEKELAIRSAEWGADDELEACRQWLEINGAPRELIDGLLAARRPKPPSLKKQALADFNWLIGRTLGNPEVDERSKRILQALESLSND